MRLLHTRRALWGLALAGLLPFTLASTSAHAAWLKYTMTADINAVTTNATSLAKMNAANMGVGAQIVTEAIVNTDIPDQDPTADIGAYPAYVRITIGDGPTVYVAEAMTRDNTANVGLNDITLFPPFTIDGWGWFGSDPTTESGPSFLGWNTQVLPESKGMAAGLYAFSPSATLGGSTALPLGGCTPSGTPCFWTLTEFVGQLILVNLVDLDQGGAVIDLEANQNVTFSVETASPVEIPGLANVPSLDAFGLSALVATLLVAGSVSAGRSRPATA
jgi:hypothetical protein